VTKAERLATDPQPTLEFVQGKASVQELWSLKCGCVLSNWRPLVDPQCRDVLKLAERYADGAGIHAPGGRHARDRLCTHRHRRWRMQPGQKAYYTVVGLEFTPA
jgi:hypothetical protein